MEKRDWIARRGTKRFAGGILFLIIGYLLWKISEAVAWVLIILGTIFIIIGLGKLQKAEKTVEDIESKIIPQSRPAKKSKKKR